MFEVGYEAADFQLWVIACVHYSWAWCEIYTKSFVMIEEY